jgi:glutamate formiminotransferase/formiminotetrahydrofolate cyclodeaminase
MPEAIVECIANYSDARRPQVIEAIMQSIRSVTGVILLDRHSDLDHNRTVLTFVGAPKEIEEAAFRSIETAARLINLDEHTGEHPRIGATDVVPFVPISGVNMQECVQIAKVLGRRVGEELHIPVYLYEEAATRAERQNLENIRRGQYEALKIEIGFNPSRDPDFGPKQVGSAGATVIGARHPLIAYNIYLNTDDIAIAKQIAKAVRFSSGGLRYVKALGLTVEGRAQVSMNLTNYRGTSLAHVVEFVRREAARYGVSLHHSELVGLIPQDALVDAAQWYLQLDEFRSEQILERRLATALEESRLSKERDTFLDVLSAGTPTPGGGSASAHSGAAGAALVAMVTRLTIGKKKYAAVQEQMQTILQRAEELRTTLTSQIDRDATAFTAVLEAIRLPQDDPEKSRLREQAIQTATLNAARVPLDVAVFSLEVMALAVQVAQTGNSNAISDGAVGATLAKAAITGAGFNVRVNLVDLLNHPQALEMQFELREIEQKAEELEKQLKLILVERGKFQW